MKSTLYNFNSTRTLALELARGDYQRALLRGTAAWSGADLQGKARDYAGSYAESRENLLERLRNAGFLVVVLYDLDDNRRKKVAITETAHGLARVLESVSYKLEF